MKTLIIGGGLSGLALAEALEAQNKDYMLLEARARFGGRIETERHDGGYYDMGPAWFWPGQPRVAALIERLDLEKFDQFAEGALTFEDEQGHVQHGRGFASMQGSWRLKGGLGALTQALTDKVPPERRRLNAAVTAISHTDVGITTKFNDTETIKADQVVLSLPPRIAAALQYTPALAQTALDSMQGISTWMAGQAKIVALYDRPFWREAGLSGDAQSRLGPMVEIHDASPAEGGPYALFGFVGVPPNDRTDVKGLQEAALAQLARLFGPEAAAPSEFYFKDWALEPYTATEADKAPLYTHPTYGLPHALTALWSNKLHFGGTEIAPQFGGYVEGALEAAENVLSRLDL